MPQITQITPQKRKGIFNIFIDGKFAFGLDAENLVKFHLKEGLNLNEGEIKSIKDEYLFNRLLASAFNFLSYRPRSKKEVEKNLDQKLYKLLGAKGRGGTNLSIKKRIIEKLEFLGLLNDKEFARWLSEQRSQGLKARGPALIKKELLGKGVSREEAERIYRRQKKSDRSGLLSSILAKKARRIKGVEYPKFRQKLLELLLRRGFDYEEAKEAVADYLKRA
ncbi:MAG: RecX family transcriptional regulator [Patescibacteria group bacterium]|nr:RecX family transcriptional regulator [Patescibacteria group bacterium]